MKRRFYIGAIVLAILLLALGRLFVRPPLRRELVDSAQLGQAWERVDKSHSSEQSRLQ